MRLRATHETQNDCCGRMTLVRLIETQRDSYRRLMKLREYWGLIRIIDCRELMRMKLMGTHETQGE